MGTLKIGSSITVRDIACTVVKVRPFGTVDVVSVCGKYAFRVTGLWPSEVR